MGKYGLLKPRFNCGKVCDIVQYTTLSGCYAKISYVSILGTEKGCQTMTTFFLFAVRE